MASRPDEQRPLFISNQDGLAKKKDLRIAPNVTKKLQFVDVIEAMIDSGEHKSSRVAEMVRLMQAEVDRTKSKSPSQV